VMTRRKFAGMRSAIVTSRAIGGAHSVAAEILRDFTRHVAPRLIKLCYVNASVRLGQRNHIGLKDEISLIGINAILQPNLGILLGLH
jgi:hypothetical protein